jgi:2-(1,2-epoxy-1,2-dihydrophenyl)acetyl-CoA isomerase
MSESPSLPHSGAQIEQAPAVLCSRILDGRVATLTINRPERKNALGPAEWSALYEELLAIREEKGIRAILVRGAGGSFCAGGDLRTMTERLEWPVAVREQQLRRDAQVVTMLHEFPAPVIAEIDGPCMGAGLALALACDLRIAAESASFGAVFHRVGLTADFGLSWLLPKAVGAGRAAELLFTAEVIRAARAQEIGIVQRVVKKEQLIDESLALCQRIADGPPLAQAMTKDALRHAETCDLRAAIAWEAKAQTLVGKSRDAAEGVAAFLGKRAPQFRGE